MTIWTIITAIATVVSMVAYIITALYIRAELKAIEKDRYLSVTSELFRIWMDPEFMKAQSWLIYKMSEPDWHAFVANHRGDYGEMAFQRVGAFYDRIGTLVRLKLINEMEILSTVGGFAIAVWQKIDPLVKEARRIENSVLFDDFEALLPSCYECYVPSLGEGGYVKPFSVDQAPPQITVQTLHRKLNSRTPPLLLDVRQPKNIADDPRKLPGALVIPPDEVERRYAELPPTKEIAVYCA
ncbi:MAG TPA: hypothetical protein VGL56_07635 [Fimbriimonadaceae bacterium]|jgi:hypothetical protein